MGRSSFLLSVEDEKAVGVYHPETSDRCSFGDLAIGFELLSRGLVDPRQANRDQLLDIIGSHAQETADRLLTRDRGFFRGYFTGLTVLDPSEPSGQA